MSLITCPECGKEISDLSETCVNCGFPVRKHAQETSQAGLCKACGCQNEADAAYCKQCGVEIHDNSSWKSAVKNIPSTIVKDYEAWKLVVVILVSAWNSYIGILLMWVLKIPKNVEGRAWITFLYVFIKYLLFKLQ